MTITTAQIRGARGILNWSQADLAERTGISATSIGSIENGNTTPRESTILTIQKAFEDGGIEFLPNEGVRRKSGEITIFQGRTRFIEFYDHLYKVIKDKPGEVLVSNVDEKIFIKWLGDFKDTHIKRINDLKTVTYKILVREDDDFLPGSSYAEYRGLPKELFASVPFYVYGDELAIILFDVEPMVIVLQYKLIADAYRVQFFDIWNRTGTKK